jgi:hypothetical protein
MPATKRKRVSNKTCVAEEDSKEPAENIHILPLEQSVPRILSLTGNVILLPEGAETMTFPGSALVFKPHVLGVDKLLLRRTDWPDEEEVFHRAASAVREEISRRQQDVVALEQQYLSISKRMTEVDPEQVEKVGEMVFAVAAQIGTHKRRVKELQRRRHYQYQCEELRQTVTLTNGVWVKLPWCDDRVMYVHPGAQPVCVLEPVEETSIVTKTRPVSNGKMFAIGGGGGAEDNRLSSVERYDEEKDQWEAVASMGIERFGVDACVLGGRVYAIGGIDNGGNNLSSVERYDEEKDQ